MFSRVAVLCVRAPMLGSTRSEAVGKARSGLEGWDGFLVQPALILVMKEGGLSQFGAVLQTRAMVWTEAE